MALDLLVISAYLGLIVWVGLSKGRREKDMNEFALAGRRMPWWAVLGSIVAAETSAGTFVGTPVEGYTLRNYTFLQLVLGAILGRAIVSYVLIPLYFKLEVYSVYEYLGKRFGPRTRDAGSAVFLVTRVLATGTRLYIAAVIPVLAIKLAWGDPHGPMQELAWFAGSISALVALTSVYTAIGGIQAVIWTDLIQATFMLGSGLLAVALLYAKIPGGWEGITHHLGGLGGVKFFSSGIEPARGWGENLRSILTSDYTIFSALIGYSFTTMATHGVDQDMVQRMLTAPDARKSRRSLLLSGLLEFPIFGIFTTAGILLYVFYQAHPEIHVPEKSNEIFGHFILTELPPGVRGLMLAGLLSTAMGSLSAALNALATSFVRDFYQPYFRPQADETRLIRQVRLVTAAFAVILVCVAAVTSYAVILSPKSRAIPIALGILGYTYGPLLGVFLLGALTRTRGSDRGNLFALLCGFAVVAVYSGMLQDIGRLLGGIEPVSIAGWTVIAFPWRILLGSAVTFGVGACFSSQSAFLMPNEPFKRTES